MMLGGLLMMLKMANLMTGAILREKGVCGAGASEAIAHFTSLGPAYAVFVG
jgi:hypothetical protein